MNIRSFQQRIIPSLLLVTFTAPTLAETAIPPSILREVIKQRRDELDLDIRREMLKPEVPVKQEEDVALEQGIPEEYKNIKLNLSGLTFVGNSFIGDEELLPLYAGMINQSVTLFDVYKLVNRITLYYNNNGYSFAKAYLAQQNIENGQVKITVDEGLISSVVAEGEFADHPIIHRAKSDIIALDVFNAKKIESILLSINGLNGARFRTVVSREGQELRVTIKSEQMKSTHVSASFDNYGSRFVGPAFRTVTVSQSNILGGFNQLSVDNRKSLFSNELERTSVNYERYLWDYKTKFTSSYSYSKANPGYDLKDFGIENTSQRLTVGLQRNIIKQRNKSLVAGVEFAADEIRSSVLSFDTTKDSVRALRFFTNYDWVEDSGSQNLLNLSYTQGLEGFLGGSRSGDALLSRNGAQADFKKVNLTFRRYDSIFDEYTLVNTVNAQYALDRLFASEEAAYGGSTFGRAYEPSQITGENGFSVLTEFYLKQYNINEIAKIQPFVFLDYGRYCNKSEFATQCLSGSSAGVGARVSVDKHIDLNFSVSKALKPLNGMTYPNDSGYKALIELNIKF